jgi:hypothetical protein
MPAFVETMSPFFAEFGEDGTLGSAPVRVIFDEPASDLLGSMARQPQVQIATADVPASAFGMTLSLARGTFTVREHLPDGTGMSLLLLTRVS